MARAKIKSAAGRARVSAKISKLAKTEPQMAPKQRVAVAYSMERAKRLGPKGAYRRVKKG